MKAKIFLVVLFCLSTVELTDRLKMGFRDEEGDAIDASKLSLENFSAAYFDARKNWEKQYPSIIQRERGLRECETWDLDEAINRKIEYVGEPYYPLKITERELESQTHPRNSIVSRVLAQYRRDLGFTAVENFDEPQASLSEVLHFVSCLVQEPVESEDFEESESDKEIMQATTTVDELAQEESEEQQRARIYKKNREEDKKMMKRLKAEWREEKKQDKVNQIIEAYSFFKYLGIITPGMTCEKFSNDSGVVSVAQFKHYYKNELSMYTFMNWDYLDLTPFENHHFPIADRITRNVKAASSSVMLPVSLEILRRHIRYIRFHNPRTLEGRKMLLFQRLYRRYFRALGDDADPSYIDWSHCDAKNWPVHVSQINMRGWIDSDVILLNQVLDSQELVFEKALILKKQTKTYEMLGQKNSFASKKPIKVDFDSIKGNECALSDDEDICGPPMSRYTENAMNKIIELRSQQLATDKADYERRHLMNFTAPHPGNGEKRASIAEKKSSNPIPISSIMFSVKVESDKPADQTKLAKILSKALRNFE